MSRRGWAAGAPVGVVAVGVVVAGCSASPGSSSSPSSLSSPSAAASSASAPSTASTASTASATATGGAASSPAATPSSLVASPTGTAGNGGGGGTAAGCATQSLQAKAGVAEGAAGSVYQVIDFTNISSTACTLFGYPGVALVAGSPPAQIGSAAARSTAAPASLVTLEPGQTANALLRITQAQNYPTASCSPTPATSLQIYPPNQTVAIYLPYTSTGCASTTVNLLSIGVVQLGSGSGD